MIKRILIILAACLPFFGGHAANVVTVAGGEGDVGSSVELSVGMDIDAKDVVAAEIHIPLPDDVVPVAGSLKKNEERLPGHSLSADLRGNEYVIVIFNTTLSPISSGTCEAFRFSLELGENPGNFSLSPSTVKLSNAKGESIACGAEGGTLIVKGARIDLSANDVDFGRVPIRGTYTQTFTASNAGTTPLHISDIITDVPGLLASASKSEISPQESAVITLTYKPVERAKGITGRMTVHSNSVGRAPFVNISSVPFSVNELHVKNAEGVSDSEVTVALEMQNMEPIVGAEVSFKLPKELEYVEGSVRAAERAPHLSAIASVDAARNLRIVLFGANNIPVAGNEGTLLTFRLRLNGTSGSYSLTPEKVVLANATEENMVSAVYPGNVSISSPYFIGENVMPLGNLPLSGSDTFDYKITNNGSAPLVVERVAFLDGVAVCDAEFPLVVNSYENKTLPIRIADPKFGEFASTMNVYSNDPRQRLKTVRISGNFYSPNELYFDGVLSDDGYLLKASLENEAEITALQLDFVVPEGVTADDASLELSTRCPDHTSTIARIDDSRYRLVCFSLKNTPFIGNEGEIITLRFLGNNLEGKKIGIENIKLSGADGKNYVTPSSEIKIAVIPVLVKKITLSKSTLDLQRRDTYQLHATVSPKNATDKGVLWSSSDPAIASVDADGRILARCEGTAVIKAVAADGSGISAECAVNVSAGDVGIKFELDEIHIKLNESLKLNAEVIGIPDNEVASCVWTSSNPETVVVSEDGVVTALAYGSALITVTLTDNAGIVFTSECKVDVDENTGIAEIDSSEISECEIYTISGARINNVARLESGIYLVRHNGKTQKLIVR